jgi:hypothetical protein
MASYKHARKVIERETVEDTYSEKPCDDNSSQSSQPSRDSRDNCDTRSKDGCGACYWPVFIFVILFIIILIVCFCSGWDYSANCGSWGTGGIFGGLFLFFIIWIIILFFFCRSGDMTAAWFFLILIFALIFVWWIANLLSNLGRC